MPWNLHEANLSREAKDFLSVLSSCGDLRKAAAEVGASEADVRRWAREPEFVEHRRKALAHYESWRDWRSRAALAPPTLWPALGRLDRRPDPFRVDSEIPPSPGAFAACSVRETGPEPGATRFIAAEDLTPHQWVTICANGPAGAPRSALFSAPSPESFPMPR